MDFDPGIRHIVEALRSDGVETFESCQGGQGHTFAQPTVRFHGGRDEGFRALACALRLGLRVAELRRYWQVVDGEPRGPHWEMTFHPSVRAASPAASPPSDDVSVTPGRRARQAISGSPTYRPPRGPAPRH